MRRTAPLLVVAAFLSGCAATDTDSTDTAVCRTVAQQRGALARLLAARPQDSSAVAAAVETLSRRLDVRDTDASDRMRGDALVLQLNLQTARTELRRDGGLPAGRLDNAFTTFARRECP